MTTINEYVDRPYLLEVVFERPEQGSAGWVANVYEFDGCQAQGDTPEELQHNIRRAMTAWISACLDAGLAIPEPGDEPEWGWAFNDLAPVLHISNVPGLASKYRDLLDALATHTARAHVPERLPA